MIRIFANDRGEPDFWYVNDKGKRVSRRNLTPEMYLEAVRINGLFLKRTRRQTPEMRELAVRQNWRAFQYATKKTPELCALAISIDPEALSHIKRQTRRIVLQAVRQDGMALQWIKTQSAEICLSASSIHAPLFWEVSQPWPVHAFCLVDTGPLYGIAPVLEIRLSLAIPARYTKYNTSIIEVMGGNARKLAWKSTLQNNSSRALPCH